MIESFPIIFCHCHSVLLEITENVYNWFPETDNGVCKVFEACSNLKIKTKAFHRTISENQRTKTDIFKWYVKLIQ
jgi:hypothetical protein